MTDRLVEEAADRLGAVRDVVREATERGAAIHGVDAAATVTFGSREISIFEGGGRVASATALVYIIRVACGDAKATVEVHVDDEDDEIDEAVQRTLRSLVARVLG